MMVAVSATKAKGKAATGEAVEALAAHLAEIDTEEASLVEELQQLADELPARRAELAECVAAAHEADDERRALQVRFDAGEFDIEDRLLQAEALASSAGRRAGAMRRLIEGYPDRAFARIDELRRELKVLHWERQRARTIERAPRLEAERGGLLDTFFDAATIDAARRLAGIEERTDAEGDDRIVKGCKREALTAYLAAVESLGHDVAPITQATESIPSDSPHQALMDRAMPEGEYQAWRAAQERATKDDDDREYRMRRAYEQVHNHPRSMPCDPALCDGHGRTVHLDGVI